MNIVLKIVKTLWRGLCCIRDVVMNVVFLLFVLLCFTLFGLFMQSSQPVDIKEGALVLNLDGYLADNRPQSSLLRPCTSWTISGFRSRFQLLMWCRQLILRRKITELKVSCWI